MIILTLAALLAPAPVLADLGPEPAMEEFAALAEPALVAKLRRPVPVTFKWPYKLTAGPAGYYTCGLASSPKKGLKDAWVSAVVAHGQAVNVQWSTMNGMLAYSCKQEIRKGKIVAR